MTKRSADDILKTDELVRERDDDKTWLRHRGLAAELDRRLLQGATAEELAEVRKSWWGHVVHLRKEHGLNVVEEPSGLWRLAASQANTATQPMTPSEIESDLQFDDDYEEGDLPAGDDAPAQEVRTYVRLNETARALAALAEKGLLGNSLIKASVGMLIRQASESNHWHNCAHYRSKKAAEVIRRKREAEPGSLNTAAKYQAFCRSTLRHEHVVPNSVIYELLNELDAPTVEAITKVLQEYCIRATITIDEDRELNGKGLSSRMPEAFWGPEGWVQYREPRARYIEAGINAGLEPLPPNMLWHEVNEAVIG